jgi:hypothetical protein
MTNDCRYTELIAQPTPSTKVYDVAVKLMDKLIDRMKERPDWTLEKHLKNYLTREEYLNILKGDSERAQFLKWAKEKKWGRCEEWLDSWKFMKVDLVGLICRRLIIRTLAATG